MRGAPGPIMMAINPLLLLVLLLAMSTGTTWAGRQVEGGSFGNEEHPRRHHHHRHDVHLAGFFPTSRGHHQSRIGQGVMPAVRLALRDVNRSPHILPNIHLRMHWNNTAVSGTSGDAESEIIACNGFLIYWLWPWNWGEWKLNLYKHCSARNDKNAPVDSLRAAARKETEASKKVITCLNC